MDCFKAVFTCGDSILVVLFDINQGDQSHHFIVLRLYLDVPFHYGLFIKLFLVYVTNARFTTILRS